MTNIHYIFCRPSELPWVTHKQQSIEKQIESKHDLTAFCDLKQTCTGKITRFLFASTKQLYSDSQKHPNLNVIISVNMVIIYYDNKKRSCDPCELQCQLNQEYIFCSRVVTGTVEPDHMMEEDSVCLCPSQCVWERGWE